MVKIVNKTTIVVLFVLMVEVFYLRIDSLLVFMGKGNVGRSTCFSLGLPFRSVKYTSENFTGTAKPLKNWLFADEQPVGLKVKPILLALDVLVLFLLVLLMGRWIPSNVIVRLVKGSVLGSVTGASLTYFSQTLPESWICDAVAYVVLFVVVPLVVYLLSLGFKRQKTIILIVMCATFLPCWRACLLTEALLEGSEMSINLGDVLRISIITGALTCECLAIMLLHRNVFSVVFRKQRAKRPLGSEAD